MRSNQVFFLLASVLLCLEAQPTKELDEYMDEKEFEDYFHLKPVTDPVEYEKRNEALHHNEEEIKEANEKYANGEILWFDRLYNFDDLPLDELEAMKEGAISKVTRAMGKLTPPPEEQLDEASERYFDHFRTNRAVAPASYSSAQLGLVSPVKNQLKCGSCTAFASMAATEVCFRKLTGVMGDYSEQAFVDCGYGPENGAWGCKGAYIQAYFNYWSKNSLLLSSEEQYPYLNDQPKLVCPNPLPEFNQGARINGSFFTYTGTEDLLKELVYENGAVVVSIYASLMFNYGGGIFAGCSEEHKTKGNHAVTVVGYGSENGTDYWLIKNSWSASWGENGFLKLQRGVGMCGIGKDASIVKCTPTNQVG